MKKLTILILLFNFTSYSQIKFKAYKYVDNSKDKFEIERKCNITIMDNSWENKIIITENNNEIIYKYGSSEISHPLFFEDDKNIETVVKYDFIVSYWNVVDQYKDGACIKVYKIKKSNTYIIKIQLALCHSIIYTANLIQGQYPQ